MKNKIISFLSNFNSLFMIGIFVLGLMPVYAIADCEHHLADSEILYDWYSCVPPSLNKSDVHCILVLPYIVLENYYEQKKAERISGEFTGKNSRSYGEYISNYITLTPYLCSSVDPFLHAPYFPREVFDPSIGDFYYRPDFKLNLMIDRLKSSLRQKGYLIHDKVILEGYSGHAIFSHRYSILNPERVEAVILGASGGTIVLPEDSYNSVGLDWPVGLHDYESLTGEPFDREAYKDIKQFIYIGSEDAEGSIVGRSGLFSQEQVNFLESTFGDISPVMLQNQCSYLKSIGYNNIVFKQYPGFMHDTCSIPDNDIWSFTESIIDSVRFSLR